MKVVLMPAFAGIEGIAIPAVVLNFLQIKTTNVITLADLTFITRKPAA